MLELTITFPELYDEGKGEFIPAKPPQTLKLEHSLVSLSKWESKWCKPYLTKVPKTTEEVIDYIRCMTLTQNVDPNAYYYLTKEQCDKIADYIEAPMTATHVTIPDDGKRSREQVTSELIYYWMLSLNIPWECQKWHLNRLLTLIKVCNAKNTPPKKRSKQELRASYAALNAARRKKLNTKG